MLVVPARAAEFARGLGFRVQGLGFRGICSKPSEITLLVRKNFCRIFPVGQFIVQHLIALSVTQPFKQHHDTTTSL